MQNRVVELFAGVGGFHLGLKRSGWNVVWANQWEPGKKKQHAADCYAKNLPDTPLINKDIFEVIDQVPDCELLVGGFPCQSYSVATVMATGIEGEKGKLWWAINKVLEKKDIPFVLLENVDRLLKSPAKQRGRDFGIILWCLNRLGYKVEWRVINAADYGFPQRRKRTFIFATKKDLGNAFEDFPGNKSKERTGTLPIKFEDTKIWAFDFDVSGTMINGEIKTAKFEATKEPKKTLRSILEDKVDQKFFINDADLKRWQYFKGSKKEERVKADGFKYFYSEGAMAFPDKLDEPSRTIITSEGTLNPNRFSHVVEIDGKHRILTPKELERLQGFPDDWTASLTDKQRSFVMGNALVVGIVERIGRKILCQRKK
jgi:DNA (cytosine-5)-methyltransferase 1